MDYQYWIIRFVPNVARGEFTNIGIVCGRDNGDWAVGFDTRSVKSHGHLSSDLRELSSWARWFKRSVDSSSETTLSDSRQHLGSGWIEGLRRRQSNSVQFSSPAPIEVGSAREGVALLFPHLVERETIRRRNPVNRRSIRASVRDLLVHELEFTVGQNLFVQPDARIGKQRGSFDIARTQHADNFLTNVWAFNLATLEPLEQEIQSWNFLVSRLRQDGALITAKGQAPIVVGADTPIEVVYDEPTSSTDIEWRSDIFEAAVEAWVLNNVTYRTTDEFFRDAHAGDLVTLDR